MFPYLSWLLEHGNQARLARLVGELTGRQPPPSTLSRISLGQRKPSFFAEALIELVRRNPELMETER